ncbi:Hypothetical protein FKW44_004027 [Caligus rogercresseyi]|uniref:Uncharacterized protein n=1 Tax=Caligus rogercresseyi TaxID=217165 RepID=A0A7T8K9N1_CALRO|nr:Hypothetical protein FKW44_004027 [Caligus rogercresseyi]
MNVDEKTIRTAVYEDPGARPTCSGQTMLSEVSKCQNWLLVNCPFLVEGDMAPSCRTATR